MVDGRWRCPKARGSTARPGRARPQGRVSPGAGRVAEGRLHPRAHRRQFTRSRRARARKEEKHDIEVVVDRLVVRAGIETRLADSLETGAEAGRGAGISRSGRRARPSSSESRRPGARGRRRPVLEDNAPPAGSSSPRSSPARSRGFTIDEIDRGCSRSTRRRALARPATGSARSISSIRTWSSRTMRCRSSRARSCPGQIQPAQSLLHAGARKPGARVRLRARNAVERTSPRSSTRSSSMAPGEAGHAAFIDGRKTTRCASRSRA